MASRGRRDPSTADAIRSQHDASVPELLSEVTALYRAGRNRDILDRLDRLNLADLPDDVRSQLLVSRGAALYDLDDVSGAISSFRSSLEQARSSSPRIQFAAAFALFTREDEVQSPEEALPALSELRQLAASIGNRDVLGALHLAVARREGMRGNFIDARRHVELARRLTQEIGDLSILCSLDTVESSVEMVSGNLGRARAVAERGFQRAHCAGFSRYLAGCATNLSALAIWVGDLAVAREYISHVMKVAATSSRMRFCALDNLMQIALFEGNLLQAQSLSSECSRLQSSLRFARPSWYELAHQSTKCQYLEQSGDWLGIVALAESVDDELTRRHLRALRTTLLCAKARALSQLDCHREAESTLVSAQRICPRGAVDALILLEASKGLCAIRKSDVGAGSAHLQRSVAACRAIGHRYHQEWIDRSTRLFSVKASAPLRRREVDLTAAALLLTDVTTILGAGHSLDLLVHRAAAVLEAALPDGRVDIQTEGGLEYQSECSSQWEQGVNGSCRIRVRGSDRAFSIRIRDAQSLDEVSLVKSVADLVRAAVHRTSDAEGDEDEQNLWPRSLVPGSDDAVFQSPRMIELLRIAIRLASTDLPILIDGETGTGKEVFARLIHEHSRVKRGPFVAYNCSAMPRDLVESQLFGHRRGAFTGATDSFPGLIRSAEHGTLFLDEVGDLDPAIQPKLLRFLEGAEIHPIGEMRPQRVPVRIVAATNANLDHMVEEGRFRRDLFYRLGVARLALPSLRERKDEIPALASLFLARYSRECHRSGVRLGDDLIAALLLYDWPGNIRQLANEIRRIVAMADDGQILHSGDLAPDITAPWNNRSTMPPAEAVQRTVVIQLDQPLDRAVDELERTFVNRAMESAGGRVADAAELLGISRKGLFLKRRRWGLVDSN